jgi:hypothetical protein
MMWPLLSVATPMLCSASTPSTNAHANNQLPVTYGKLFAKGLIAQPYYVKYQFLGVG